MAKSATEEIMKDISCEEFRKILESREDIADICEDKELYFKFFKHIDSATGKNCEACQRLFLDKQKIFKKKNK